MDTFDAKLQKTKVEMNKIWITEFVSAGRLPPFGGYVDNFDIDVSVAREDVHAAAVVSWLK